MKNPEMATTTDMQPESGEAEVKLNVSIQKGGQEENGNKAVEIELVNKEFLDHIASEQTCEYQTSTNVVQEATFAEREVVSQEKEGISLENNAATKELEDQEENDMKLTFEFDQSPTKNGEERSNNIQPKDNNKEELSALQAEDELKNGINEKEDRPSDVQASNESYSVDIVESTTSEISETPQSVIQSDAQKGKAKMDDNTVSNDTPFVSYDSSIMLKNVQIRLNDCLKDNSNLLDANKYKDVDLQISKYLTRDMSFGKTLRGLAGRYPIHKLRERRISPNSSLFVNTSSVSLPQDEGMESKIFHYSSVFSDSFPTNGSPLDRKRKLDAEECSSAKKQKTDGNSSFLNRSTNLLKSWYNKPNITVSTPKATSYDFEPSKLDISGIINNDDNKITVESTESTKKWCVIM
ncbi:uncharacterized protein LOC105281761 isoform X2 [Ooceraea biroi]|nr:uncharacterized protein LOC105281761 isoform X2 [Ooceraea biroi]